MAVTLNLVPRYYSSPDAGSYPTSGTGYYNAQLELNETLTINWPSSGIYGTGSPNIGETASFIQIFKSYTNTSNAVYPYVVTDQSTIPGTSTFSFNQAFTGTISMGLKDSIETDAFHFRIRIDITAEAFQPDTNISLNVSGDTTSPFYYTTGGSSHPSVTGSVAASNDTIYWITTSNTGTGNMVGREVGRTYNLNTNRVFYGPTSTGDGTAITDMPSVGSSKRYYIWASDTIGEGGVYTGDSYLVSRPDTSITLTPSNTNPAVGESITVNVTGDSSNTRYRLISNNYGGQVGSTYDGGGSSSTDFTISAVANELPSTTATTWTYFTEARIISGGTAQWISTGDSFNITTGATIGPTAFSFTPVPDANLLTYYQASTTITGISGASPPVSVSSSNGTGQVSLNGTTWSSSLASISNNATLYIRVQSASSYSTGASATATINGQSGTFTVTTRSQGTSGTIPPVTPSTYGLEVRGPNGTSTVFSPNYRFCNSVGATNFPNVDPQEEIIVPVPGASGTSTYVVIKLTDTTGTLTITKEATQYKIKNSSLQGEPSTGIFLAILIG